MIQPTVGRIVHYHAYGDKPQLPGLEPLAAIVTWVHSDRMVNLVVFDANGEPHARTSVTLVQPEDEVPEVPDENLSYATWMPYQVKKDHGSESGERTAGTEAV